MNPSPTRDRLLRGLRGYLHRERAPRLVMLSILTLTLAAGLSISRGLLAIGMIEMPVRYPIAVFGAWAAFLVLVWAWARLEAALSKPPDLTELAREGGPYALADPNPFEKAGDASFRALKNLDDVPDLGGLDGEGCLVLIIGGALLLLVIGTFSSIASLIWAAPELLAEVFLDAVIAAIMTRQLGRQHLRDWTDGVLRRTWKGALGLAVIMCLIGVFVRVQKPGAHTIGDLWRTQMPPLTR